MDSFIKLIIIVMKRLLRFSILLLMVSVAQMVIAGTPVTVTIGNGTSSSMEVPCNGYYNYSWSAQIYSAAEFGGNFGSITNLSYYVTNSVSAFTRNNQKIFMAVVSDSVFNNSNYISPSSVNAVLVYNGSITWDGNSWKQINLQTPFFYGGQGNLMILYENYDGSYGSNYPFFSGDNFSSFKTINAYQDASMPTGTGSFNYFRAHVKFEIQSYDYDLAIGALNNPILGAANPPNANATIGVKIINIGNYPMSNFTVSYSIDNGVNYINETVTDTIFVDSQLNYNFTTKANLSSIGSKNIILKVSAVGDENSANNQMNFSFWVCNPLSGIYTVSEGGTGADFNSLQDALMLLNSCGISGPVTLVLNPGTYAGMYFLGHINGISATNTITIKSNGGAILRPTAYNNVKASFQLSGAKHIIFESLFFENIVDQTSSSVFKGIVLSNNSDSIVIKNCIFELGTNYMENVGIMASGNNSYFTNGNNFNYLKIQNNQFYNGYCAIQLAGMDSYTTQGNAEITGNIITAVREVGISLMTFRNAQIANNVIKKGSNSVDLMKGIYVNSCIGAIEISKNNIHILGGYGIQFENVGYFNQNDSALVSNNFILLNPRQSSYISRGFSSYNGSKIGFIHNTISINGELSSNAPNGIYLGGSGNSVFIINNIMANFSGGYNFYSDMSTENYWSNYNNYFGAQGIRLYQSGGGVNDYYSLASWLQTGMDSNSVNINPDFNSSTDLHTFSISLNNHGMPRPEVVDDIEGQARSATTPDMGADEFTPLANNLILKEITSDFLSLCGTTANQTLIAKVINSGTNSASNFQISFKLDNYALVNETYSGTLASEDTLLYTFTSPLNLSQGGEHQIQVFVNLAAEQNRFNDTISMKFSTFQSINQFPFYETFTEGKNKYFEPITNSQSMVSTDNNHGRNDQSSLLLAGGNYEGWNYYGSDFSQNLAQNSQHLSRAKSCNVNASAVSNLKMSFYLRTDENNYQPYHTWFWVAANDSVILKDVHGDSIWNSGIYNYTLLTYDLSAFAGSNFSLSFNGLMRFNEANGQENHALVDDIRIWVPVAKDVGVVDVTSSSDSECGKLMDSMFVAIQNFGLQPQTNIPFSLNGTFIDSNYSFTSVMTDTLQADEIAYAYVGMMNTRGNGIIDLKMFTTLSGDTVKSNDTLNIKGEMKSYDSIPHIEAFNSDGHPDGWEFNLGFNVQEYHWDNYYSKVLAYESSGNYTPPTSYNNQKPYAYYRNAMGLVTDKTVLTFKIRVFPDQETGFANFSDNIKIMISTDCDTNYFSILNINSSNVSNYGTLQNVYIPLSAYAGEVIKMGVEVDKNGLSNYVLAMDNMGLIESFSFDLGEDDYLCTGTTKVLKTGLPQNGYSTKWILPSGAVVNADSIIATTPGNYVCMVSNTDGLEITDQIYLLPTYPANAFINGNKSAICNGDSTILQIGLSGFFPMAVEWSEGTTHHLDTAFTSLFKYFSPQTSTLYKIDKVTDMFGCVIENVDTFSLTVNALPSVNATAIASSFCSQDQAVSLNASPSGGTFEGAGVSDTMFNPQMAIIGSNIILYNYMDANGCKGSDTISTMVYPQPMVSIVSTVDTLMCKNELPVTIFAYPSGGTYTGSGMSGNVFNPALSAVGIQTITYQFTSANNCSSKDSITIDVQALPAVSITSTLNAAYCQTEAIVALSATPTGGIFTGNGVQSGNFDPSVATLGNSTIIYQYSDGNGCSNADTIITLVNPQPNVMITSLLQSQYCKDASNVTLSASPSGGSFTGNGVTGSLFSPSSATMGYTTIVYNYTHPTTNCSNSDTVTTLVNDLPIVTIPAFADVCKNLNEVTLTGGSPSGGMYSGNFISSTQSKFYPAAANVGLNAIDYSFTDGNGCTASASQNMRVVGIAVASFNLNATVCKNDTTLVSFTGIASSAATFAWNFDNATIQSGTLSGPYQLKWNNSGVKALSLQVTDSGCVSPYYNDYINIIEAQAIATAIGSPNVCHGDSVTLFANSGSNYKFQWYDSNDVITSFADTLAFFSTTQSGGYYVSLVTELGCKASSNQINIDVNPLITSNFTIPTIACKDDMVSLQYTGQSGVNATFNWNFDQATIASGSGVGPYNLIWNTDSIKNVSLMVSENGCNSLLTTNSINILTTPAQITALGSTSFCDGGEVTLSANSGPFTYEWFKDGNSLQYSQALYSATASGSYAVKVTNSVTGCTNTSSAVTVQENTNDFGLAFSANQTSFNIPPFAVSFTNQTPNVNDYYWMWSFGDGISSTFINPSHQYNYDGNYTVGVIAQNIQTGCFDTLVKSNYIHCLGGNPNPCVLNPAIGSNGQHNICPGDSIKLYSLDHTTGISYQWLRDGILLAGATDSVYFAKQTGLFQLFLVDTACSAFSQPYSVTLRSVVVPIILTHGSIIPCSGDSMELYVNTNFNGYQWSNGAATPSIFVNNSGSFIVTVTNNNGCSTASSPFVVNASLLQSPNICIVGIDSATNFNRIIWERQNSNMIDSFKVYRESTVSGVYELVGSTPFSAPSIMTDPNSNPAQRAYRYRITAIDTCGMETPPSQIHKTIHLNINAGLNNTWNLIWDGYQGFNFGSYRIYRGSDSTQLQLLTQIQSTLSSYTDLTPPSGNLYYQIEVMAPHSCYPDSVFSKANTNYNSSRSNTANSAQAGHISISVAQGNQSKLILYPNPNKGSFTILVESTNPSSRTQFEVLNSLGERVYSEVVSMSNKHSQTFNLTHLSKGIYFIRMQNDDEIITTKFIVE